MERHCDEIKTLFMGHSQIEQGLDPSVIGDSTYNLAIAGRVIYFDYELLRRYVPRMHSLKNVIVPMHYSFLGFSGFYDKDDTYDTYQSICYYYKKYMGIKYPGYKDYKSVFSYRFLNSFTFNDVADDKGFRAINKIFDKNLCPPCKQVEMDRYRNTLFLIAELCNKYGVRLIVITTPCSNAFLQATTERGIKNMYNTIDSISQLFPLEYKNYINDSEFRNDSLFCDASHLNFIGAQLFTQRIKEDFGL